MGMSKSARGGEYVMVHDVPTKGIAYAIQRQASSRRIEVLGIRHADTMAAMTSFFKIWCEQYRHREIEPVAMQILLLTN